MGDDSAERRDLLVAQLGAQQRVLALEERWLAKMLDDEPATSVLSFGIGQQAEQTVDGDQRAAWNGLAILNPTPLTIYAGDGPGGALLPKLVVPPFSWVCLPLQFVNYSLGVRGADLLAPVQAVTFVRLRNPPAGVRAGRMGGLPIADTLTSSGAVTSPGAFAFLDELDLPAGIYDVDVMTAQTGTVDNKATNINFYFGSADVFIGPLPSLAAPQTTRFRRLTVPSAHPALTCYTNAAGGAGSIYVAAMTATRIA